jgi:hypothetical protein
MRIQILIRLVLDILKLLFLVSAVCYAVVGSWDIATFWIVCAAWFDLYAQNHRLHLR